MKGRVIIIAEAGVNHNGDMELACKMIRRAREAGADYIKFQTAVPEMVISSIAPKAAYQKETTGEEQSQLEMCKAIHLPLEAYAELKRLCEKEGIGFLSTPFDLKSIELLDRLGMDYFKVPSGEITNLPYLRAIAACGRKVILSTGMSEPEEIETAVRVLTGTSEEYPSESRLTRDDIILLHCNTQYPTPYCDVNLKAMKQMRETLGIATGYSDHTQGLEIPIAAVASGAVMIEKHFTLSREMEGPDHKASLEPDELKRMVEMIRHTEEAMGSGAKHVTESERPNIEVARKSIVAACDIKAGELLTEDNITTKRPGNGLSPMLWDKVIGTRAISDFEYDSLIEI